MGFLLLLDRNPTLSQQIWKSYIYESLQLNKIGNLIFIYKSLKIFKKTFKSYTCILCKSLQICTKWWWGYSVGESSSLYWMKEGGKVFPSFTPNQTCCCKGTGKALQKGKLYIIL